MLPDADVGTPSPGWLIPKPARPLTGQERFSSDPSSVLDFWRWAFSDLRTNIVRGVLAEYLVARAVGDLSPLRKAWDNWDVTTATGIKVEVKSSAYLQSWNQRKLSAITFSTMISPALRSGCATERRRSTPHRWERMRHPPGSAPAGFLVA
jgi:hypothetical protein